MLADTYPIQVLLMTLSGLVNRHQANVIAYPVEEGRVPKKHRGSRADRASADGAGTGDIQRTPHMQLERLAQASSGSKIDVTNQSRSPSPS